MRPTIGIDGSVVARLSGCSLRKITSDNASDGLGEIVIRRHMVDRPALRYSITSVMLNSERLEWLSVTIGRPKFAIASAEK